jgi:hypothetical protein
MKAFTIEESMERVRDQGRAWGMCNIIVLGGDKAQIELIKLK